MISGVQKISVYDPSTGTVVQLNNVVSDGEAKIASPLSYKDVDGKNKYDGDKSYLSFGCYDDGGFAQLATWMKAKTPVRIVTAGFEENILWYESAPILVNKSYSFAVGNRNYFSLQISKEGGTHNIKSIANLMLGAGLWYDANTDGVADGLIKSGTITSSFDNVNLRQKVDWDLGDTGYVYNKVEYPIAGLDTYYRFNKYDESDPGIPFTTGLVFRNFADSAISATYGESCNAVSPASTYYFLTSLNLNATADLVFVRYNIPYFGVNRKSFTNINY